MIEAAAVRELEPMHVLIGVDGSDQAAVAVELVGNIGWPPGTRIVVAQAVQSGAALYGGPWPALALAQADRLEAQIRADAERIVGDARARLVSPDRVIEAALISGRPASAIVEHAQSMGADLIVVGRRGHGTIESMVLGSVSAEVIDHARTPVLVARSRGMDRIVLAWDGSSSASGAAALLERWPIFARSQVTVLSIADIEVPWWTGFPEAGSPELMPSYGEATDAARLRHQQLAGEMTSRLRAAGLEAKAEQREGDAATQILAAATDLGADLIVIGTHGRTGLARLLLGSVARNVVHHAPCSVLVVRETSDGPGGQRAPGASF